MFAKIGFLPIFADNVFLDGLEILEALENLEALEKIGTNNVEECL
jgi:hypothetical protein